MQPRVEQFLNLRSHPAAIPTRTFTSFFSMLLSIAFFIRATASIIAGSSRYASPFPPSATSSSVWYEVEQTLSALNSRSFTTYSRAIFTGAGVGFRGSVSRYKSK